ncbi:hypothetical protein SNE510_76250 [Streptomyces sp. NE5-10]|nr:hypothetical protein [Streptomyces sp. NE5-10]GHJ98106.1 hypothetical protein SNE510_76250 [Streptomyces sp. NE5-10]
MSNTSHNPSPAIKASDHGYGETGILSGAALGSILIVTYVEAD